MTGAGGVTGTAPSRAELAALTIVPDGDAYIVGSPRSAEYVAVPELGAQILRWLADGAPLAECAARAEAAAGEPVDVGDFLAELARQGLFDADAIEQARPGFVRAGRLLFHPVAWGGYALATVTGAVLLIAEPKLRPSYRDMFPFSTPLRSFLAVTVLTIGCIVVHELAHVLATAALGVYSSLSVGRRLYFITAQADLTRLWGVPRRRRFGPLLAGMAWDAASLGGLLVAEVAVGRPVPLLRTLVLVQFTGLVLQGLIFMRTDLYALFVTATGCRNLWGVKGALLRRYLRRASAEDERTLAGAGRRELAWARFYLCLYLPGLIFAGWYLVSFAVPGVARMVGLSVATLRTGGLTGLAGWEAVAAIGLVVVPMLIGLAGVARTAVRLLRATFPVARPR